MKKKPFLKLQTKIILLVCGVVAVSLIVANALITQNVESNVRENLGMKAMDISRTVAHSPVVISALTKGSDDGSIQEYANAVRDAINVEFVVVFDMQGIRKSHPDLSQIGQHLVGGDELPSLQGEEYISYAEGTRGPSLRAFSPIFSSDGRQVGAVVVGILLGDVEKALLASHKIIYFATLIGLVTGIFFAVLLARNIKRTLFGLEPFAIAKLVEERNAMLQCVREGILAVDKNRMITVANKEARRVLEMAGIPGDPTGRLVDEYIPHTRLQYILSTGKSELDQEQYMNGVAILTNRFPVIVNGEIVGAIATFRDMTEMRQLAEELTGISGYVEALRSQAHEFMNKMHVILGLVRLKCYDQLADYINQIANKQLEEFEFVGHCIHDHVLVGLLLSKFSRAREVGIKMELAGESSLPDSLNIEVTHDLVTIIGNLVDNAFEAAKDSSQKKVRVLIQYREGMVVIEVMDSGPGIDPALAGKIFDRGYSTKAAGRGFGLFLVARAVVRLNGQVQAITDPEGWTCFRVRIPYWMRGEAVD